MSIDWIDVSTTTPRIAYTATASQTLFTVPFVFFENEDLFVYQNTVLLLLTTQYTVSGAENAAGGTVTLLTGATAGDEIMIVREVAIVQTTHIPPSGPLDIPAVNIQFSKLIAIDQQLSNELQRSIHFPDSDPNTSSELASAATRASKLLGFDSSGNLIYPVGPTFVGNTSTGVAEVDSRATAQVTTFAVSVNVIQTHGLVTPGDGGGADYVKGIVSDPGAFLDGGGTQYWKIASAIAIIGAPQCRLTLTSGVAVTTSDVAGATSIYCTPTGGNQLAIYNGVSMVPTTFTELTLALDSNAGHTNYHQSGKNFDCFVINDSSTIRLGTGPTWNAGAVAGSDTVRGTGAGSTELQLVNGLWTNKNAITIRFGSVSGNTVAVAANKATFIGTFRTTADGVTEDSAVKRFVYNAYNQARRTMLRQEATASWAYSTATYRQANASTSNQLAYVAGLAGSALDVTAHGIALNSTPTTRVVYTGIGLDSTTVNSRTTGDFTRISDATIPSPNPKAQYVGACLLGFHFVAWLEKGTGTDTQTWFGVSGSDFQSGIYGSVFN